MNMLYEGSRRLDSITKNLLSQLVASSMQPVVNMAPMASLPILKSSSRNVHKIYLVVWVDVINSVIMK